MRRALWLVAFLSIFLMLFSVVGVHGDYSVPPREIQGSAAFLPFSLVVTFTQTKTVNASMDAASKTKPQLTILFDSVTFRTNEVDTYTLWLTLIYPGSFSQVIWVFVYSANAETDKEAISVTGSRINLIFKIRTSIQPSYEEYARRQENVIWSANKQVLDEIKKFPSYFTQFKDDITALVVLLTVGVIFLLARDLWPELKRFRR